MSHSNFFLIKRGYISPSPLPKKKNIHTLTLAFLPIDHKVSYPQPKPRPLPIIATRYLQATLRKQLVKHLKTVLMIIIISWQFQLAIEFHKPGRTLFEGNQGEAEKPGPNTKVINEVSFTGEPPDISHFLSRIKLLKQIEQYQSQVTEDNRTPIGPASSSPSQF